MYTLFCRGPVDGYLGAKGISELLILDQCQTLCRKLISSSSAHQVTMASHTSEKSPDGYIEQVSYEHVDNEVAGDKDEIDLDHARQLQTGYVPDTPEEKALVRKLDWRLVVSPPFSTLSWRQTADI